MKIFNINYQPKTLIFDMDNTLYSNSSYALHQEKVLVEALAHKKKWTATQAQEKVDLWRSNYVQENKGRKPSLGNTFEGLGVSIATSISWRQQYIKPDLFLEKDPQLISTLQDLHNHYTLAVVTNNPVSIAQQTLTILGVKKFFSVIIGLDSTKLSKPDPAAFRLAAEKSHTLYEDCISIGDRFEVDIEPPLLLGMAGILVDGVIDVYNVPTVLEPFKTKKIFTS